MFALPWCSLPWLSHNRRLLSKMTWQRDCSVHSFYRNRFYDKNMRLKNVQNKDYTKDKPEAEERQKTFILDTAQNHGNTRFFYKNNFIRTTRLKFAQKLRTSWEKLRLGFRFKCNWKFLLNNTTHHVTTCSLSLQAFLQLETLSEQRRKSKMCRTCSQKPNENFNDSAEVYNWHDGNKNNLRTELRLKLCKNLRTTRLGRNFLVLIINYTCSSILKPRQRHLNFYLFSKTTDSGNCSTLYLYCY